MGKVRRRERSETEYLRGEIRKLESENRQLKRDIKQANKRTTFFEDIVDDVVEPTDIEEKCEECKTGSLKLLDLKHVTYLVCDSCNYRVKK